MIHPCSSVSMYLEMPLFWKYMGCCDAYGLWNSQFVILYWRACYRYWSV